MRKLAFIYLFLLSAVCVSAQSIDELNSILNKSKNPFVKPESLDEMMISLRKFESKPLPDQDSLMLQTYKVISTAYVANNHFKQGLEVFNRYLTYKENMLSKDKSFAINAAVNTVSEKKRNDETELVTLQHQLSSLNEDNTAITKRTVLFKSYFTLILIVLSVGFAVVLVSYTISSFNLRSRLNYNRSTMKNIHHLATTGRYEEGVRNAMDACIKSVEGEVSYLQKNL